MYAERCISELNPALTLTGSSIYQLSLFLDLHDARRDIPQSLQHIAMSRFADALGWDQGQFATQAALLSFQRNLRIIGIFRKLAKDRGKPGYLTHLPRVFRLVSQALQNPCLAGLRSEMQAMLPELRP